ncbi:tolB precursor [Micractinium conductrix]|uniref:TolB n=1 Tax=Micractinium conductrix TaxID=554055 RepID=A0A2P6V890_9CHLO|nr:tolB precursor [Micractinium conductrix]|eukprot:PSC70301.1 tolB precursor [Micractinium conductrix]
MAFARSTAALLLVAAALLAVVAPARARTCRLTNNLCMTADNYCQNGVVKTCPKGMKCFGVAPCTTWPLWTGPGPNCTPNGKFCKKNDNCCSGRCNGSPRVCKAPPEPIVCKAQGRKCGGNGECCNKYCFGGICCKKVDFYTVEC